MSNHGALSTEHNCLIIEHMIMCSNHRIVRVNWEATGDSLCVYTVRSKGKLYVCNTMYVCNLRGKGRLCCRACNLRSKGRLFLSVYREKQRETLYMCVT